MKKLPFSLNSKQKQHGIALIFALAMLSLLLIMAIGFATSAIFEQKAAYNSANTTSARLLCQTAASRVLYLLYQQISLYGETLDYSYDNWTVNKGDVDMLDHLTTNIANTPIYTYNTSQPVTWEYIKINDGTTDRLLGRFAYVVIPIGGIDPAAVVKSGTREETTVATERRIGAAIDEINIMAVSPNDIVASATPGTDQVSAGSFNYAATVGSTPAGKLPASGLWTSLTNMFSASYLNITSGPLKSKLMKWFIIDPPQLVNEYYWVDRDGNGLLNHVAVTNNEKYHRFNLSRTAAQWNAFNTISAMYSSILLDSTGGGTPNSMPTAVAAGDTYTSTNDGVGIPWLAFFGYDKNGVLDNTQKGTFPSVSARRCQIAANLVDYCVTDTDPPGTLPTSDVTPSSWYNGTTWGAIPNFTGNKKTPYLNELGFHIIVELQQTNVGGTNSKGHGKAKGKNKNNGAKNILDLAVSIDAFAELVDIYGVTLPATASTVYVDYVLTYTVTGTSAPGAITCSGTMAIPILKSDWVAGVHYTAPATWNTPVLTTPDPINTVQISLGTAVNVSVSNIKLQINKAVLNYNGKNYDYAKLNASSTLVTTPNLTIAPDTTDTVDRDYFFGLQANDPRQNLNPGDWTINQTAVVNDGTCDVAQYTTLGCGTFEAVNNCLSSAAGLDQEATTDPAGGLSTAYIRQGPMVSPWELGLIHRGAAWQTINLKEYDPNKAYKFVNTGSGIIPGGCAYSDTVNGGGDANILNQVKMNNSTTKNYVSYKKVNLNSTYLDSSTGKNITLQALLANIRIGNKPANLGLAASDTEGSKIIAPSTGIDKVVSGIMNKLSGMDYLTRAEVANAMYCSAPGVFKRALSEGVCEITQDTDAKQEELIGKFINITDVGGKNNYFYVIVVAQAIKDVGGPSTGSGMNITKSKMNGTTRISSQVSCKLGSFDYDNTNNLYFDEITGEQKIKLLVFADPSDSNRCKILSYEFIQ